MTIEELYNLKNKVRKEVKPVIDEVIYLREQNERINIANDRLNVECRMQREYIIMLNKVLDVIREVND